MNLLSNILVKYKLLFFLMGIFLFVGAAFLVPLPSFTGSLDGFQLENNEHFINYRKTDSLFDGKLKVLLVIVPEDDNLEKTFLGVGKLTKDLKQDFGEFEIVSPLTFYSKMRVHFDGENNSVSSFLSDAKEVPILEQLIANDRKSFLLVLTTNNKAACSSRVRASVTNQQHTHCMHSFYSLNTIC